MKALQISQYGAADILELNQNAPKAAPMKEQVLVEVQAASINPIDWKVRTGYMRDAVPFTMPATLGGDCCGMVTGVGESVSGLKIGDRVYGYASLLSSFNASSVMELPATSRATSSAL